MSEPTDTERRAWRLQRAELLAAAILYAAESVLAARAAGDTARVQRIARAVRECLDTIQAQPPPWVAR